MLQLNHHNDTYSAGLPTALGDVQLGQDYFRDMNFQRDLAGLTLADLLVGQNSLIISGGITTQGAGDSVSVTDVVAYSSYAITIPTSTSIPPTTAAATINAIRIATNGNLTSRPVTGGQIDNNLYANATLNGVAVNYVKLKYKENSGIPGSRTRQYSSGSYVLELTPSYELRIEPVAPVTGEVQLDTFTGTSGGSFTFSGSSGTRYAFTNNTSAVIVRSGVNFGLGAAPGAQHFLHKQTANTALGGDRLEDFATTIGFQRYWASAADYVEAIDSSVFWIRTNVGKMSFGVPTGGVPTSKVHIKQDASDATGGLRIERGATDTLDIYMGSGGELYIQKDGTSYINSFGGKWSINVTNPASDWHIKQSANVAGSGTRLEMAGGSGYTELYTDGAGRSIYSNATGGFFLLDGSGNMGLQISPTARLHVKQGNDGNTGGLWMEANSTSNRAYMFSDSVNANFQNSASGTGIYIDPSGVLHGIADETLASTGHWKSYTAFKITFGITGAIATGTTVTYEQAFGTTTLAVVPVHYGTFASVICNVGTTTPSGFVLNHNSGGSDQFFYLAVGF